MATSSGNEDREKKAASDLPLDVAIDGMRLGAEHVSELIDDALVLLHAGRPLRAIFLAIVALEELGKLGRLVSVERYRQDGRMDVWWKAFRDHRQKLTMSGLNGARAYAGVMTDDDIAAIADGRWGLALNAMKMASLYLDFAGGAFVAPSSRFDDPADRAASLIEAAKRECDRLGEMARLMTPALMEAAAAETKHFTSALADQGIEGTEAVRRAYDPERGAIGRVRKRLHPEPEQ